MIEMKWAVLMAGMFDEPHMIKRFDFTINITP